MGPEGHTSHKEKTSQVYKRVFEMQAEVQEGILSGGAEVLSDVLITHGGGHRAKPRTHTVA